MKRTHDEVGASASASAAAPPDGAASLPQQATERVRCSEDEDGPTIEAIFDEVILQNPKNHARNVAWLGLFESNCQIYGWNNCGCEYHEHGDGSSAYCMSHGAASISMNVAHFLGYFVPRKMDTPDLGDMKRCAATLRQLVTHCVARGYLVREDTKEVLEMIKISGNFNAEGIASALQRLSDEGWWDALAEEEGGEEDNVDEGEDDDDDKYIMRGELPLYVKEVRSDGWVFEEMGSGGGYDSDGSFNPDEGPPDATLCLPPHVAAMGLVGMSISCMHLVMRHGVLRPVGANGFGAEMVCANVYPP